MPVKVGLKYIEKWNSKLENAVVGYEQEPIHKGQIVLYGPSNFTRWSQKYGMTPVREVLLGKSGQPCVVNRGFGSSCAEHQLYYYPRMVRPLEPKVLVYSSYGNGSSFGYTDEETWEIAQRVVAYALTDFPDIHVYLCAANIRTTLTEEAAAKRRKYNSWLKEFAENTPGCYYIDASEWEELSNPDLLVADGVHFNAEGYRLYGEFFKEVLKDELARF